MAQTTLEIQHRTLIEEEKIELTDLPNEIKKAIRGFNVNLNNFTKNPSEEFKKKIIMWDVIICDNIQNWIEGKQIDAEELDYDIDNELRLAEEEAREAEAKKKQEEEEKKAKLREEEEKKKQQQEEEQRMKMQQEEEEKRKALENSPEQVAKRQVEALQNAVKSKMVGKIITESDLRTILGREPSWPEQKIGNMILKKVYMRKEYTLA